MCTVQVLSLPNASNASHSLEDDDNDGSPAVEDPGAVGARSSSAQATIEALMATEMAPVDDHHLSLSTEVQLSRRHQAVSQPSTADSACMKELVQLEKLAHQLAHPPSAEWCAVIYLHGSKHSQLECL